MDVMQAIRARHSVRCYTERSIEDDVRTALEVEIAACNTESGLHIQLITDEPAAFTGLLAHYGKFSGVRNYIVLAGQKGAGLEEKVGYYGERVALHAQMLGLNTCWVALTFRRGKTQCVLNRGEKLVCVLAVGYGCTQGLPHKSKPMEKLCRVTGPMPAWFQRGMEAALLAPTAVNQQKFCITLADGVVSAAATGGFYDKVDLGIVKYHFEQGAGGAYFCF